jgi:hypothetical protein
MKNTDGRRTYRSLAGGDGTTAVNLQMEIWSPPVMSGRGRSNNSDEAEDVIRRRAGGRWRRRSFSVPQPGGEVQETRERRKKKTLWDKKSKFTPTPVFILRDRGRGDRGKCSTTPTVSAGRRHVAARSGAAVPITVPLGNDGL